VDRLERMTVIGDSSQDRVATKPPRAQIARRGPWIWFTVALAVTLVALLVGPRVPDDQQAAMCVVNIHLPGPFGLSLNCDSPEHMRLASDPAALLDPQNPRQARPGLILAAALLALPLAPLRVVSARLQPQAQRADIDRARISNALANYPPAFAAYLVLNVLFLLLAFGCLVAICTRAGIVACHGSTPILVALGILLLANDVTEVFLWSPHMQLFNILVPLLAVDATLRAYADGLGDRRYALAMGAVIGIGFLAYPLFVVIVPCLVLPALVRSLRLSWPAARMRLGHMAILVALAAAPYAAWYAFVRLKTGGFYHHEVALGQVVWMQEAWQDGVAALVRGLAQNVWALIELAARQALAVGAVLLWTIAMLIPAARATVLRPFLPVAAAGVFASAIIALFYASVGLIVSRLAYALVPPLIAIAGAAAMAAAHTLSQRRSVLLALGCLLIAVVQFAIVVIEPPPPT
jgi:hypothetical protein